MAETVEREIAENCISEPSDDELSQILSQLTVDQIRFVVARQECSTDREAARAIGMSESTVYRWPATVKRAVELMVRDGLTTALHLRRRALAKAMLVKVKGLDSGDERVRQAAASEIIEWELGKAQQPQKISGDQDAPLVTRVIFEEVANWRGGDTISDSDAASGADDGL
jgi:hypothetical protein